MMRLGKYEGYKIVLEPEALLLKPFKLIWNRDRTQNKNKATMELGFIYFFCDSRSDYQYLTDEEQRMSAIKEGEGLPSDWKPDKVVQDAMNYYNSIKPVSSLLLEDTRAMVNGYRAKLRELTNNMADLDVKEVKEIGAIIKQIPSLVKDLDEAERAVAKEMAQNEKVRGAQEKSMYEDV